MRRHLLFLCAALQLAAGCIGPLASLLNLGNLLGGGGCPQPTCCAPPPAMPCPSSACGSAPVPMPPPLPTSSSFASYQLQPSFSYPSPQISPQAAPYFGLPSQQTAASAQVIAPAPIPAQVIAPAAAVSAPASAPLSSYSSPVASIPPSPSYGRLPVNFAFQQASQQPQMISNLPQVSAQAQVQAGASASSLNLASLGSNSAAVTSAVQAQQIEHQPVSQTSQSQANYAEVSNNAKIIDDYSDVPDTGATSKGTAAAGDEYSEEKNEDYSDYDEKSGQSSSNYPESAESSNAGPYQAATVGSQYSASFSSSNRAPYELETSSAPSAYKPAAAAEYESSHSNAPAYQEASINAKPSTESQPAPYQDNSYPAEPEPPSVTYQEATIDATSATSNQANYQEASYNANPTSNKPASYQSASLDIKPTPTSAASYQEASIDASPIASSTATYQAASIDVKPALINKATYQEASLAAYPSAPSKPAPYQEAAIEPRPAASTPAPNQDAAAEGPYQAPSAQVGAASPPKAQPSPSEYRSYRPAVVAPSAPQGEAPPPPPPDSDYPEEERQLLLAPSPAFNPAASPAPPPAVAGAAQGQNASDTSKFEYSSSDYSEEVNEPVKIEGFGPAMTGAGPDTDTDAGSNIEPKPGAAPPNPAQFSLPVSKVPVPADDVDTGFGLGAADSQPNLAEASAAPSTGSPTAAPRNESPVSQEARPSARPPMEIIGSGPAMTGSGPDEDTEWHLEPISSPEMPKAELSLPVSKVPIRENDVDTDFGIPDRAGLSQLLEEASSSAAPAPLAHPEPYNSAGSKSSYDATTAAPVVLSGDSSADVALQLSAIGYRLRRAPHRRFKQRSSRRAR